MTGQFCRVKPFPPHSKISQETGSIMTVHEVQVCNQTKGWGKKVQVAIATLSRPAGFISKGPGFLPELQESEAIYLHCKSVELKKSRKEGWALVHCLVTFTSGKVTHLILGSHYKMKENIWENKACICLAIYVSAANMAFGNDAGHCLTHLVASILGKAVTFESGPLF